MVHFQMIDWNHLSEVRENYFVHFWYTVRLFAGFLFLAVISLIHGLIPFILTSTVSNQISDLNDRLKER